MSMSLAPNRAKDLWRSTLRFSNSIRSFGPRKFIMAGPTWFFVTVTLNWLGRQTGWPERNKPGDGGTTITNRMPRPGGGIHGEISDVSSNRQPPRARTLPTIVRLRPLDKP